MISLIMRISVDPWSPHSGKKLTTSAGRRQTSPLPDVFLNELVDACLVHRDCSRSQLETVVEPGLSAFVKCGRIGSELERSSRRKMQPKVTETALRCVAVGYPSCTPPSACVFLWRRVRPLAAAPTFPEGASGWRDVSEGPLPCRLVRGFLLLESVGVRLCFRPHGLLSFPEEETSVIWEPSQLQGQRTEFGSVLSGSAGHRFPSGRGLCGWEAYRTELCWHHAVLCFLNPSVSKEEAEAEKRGDSSPEPPHPQRSQPRTHTKGGSQGHPHDLLERPISTKGSSVRSNS